MHQSQNNEPLTPAVPIINRGAVFDMCRTEFSERVGIDEKFLHKLEWGKESISDSIAQKFLAFPGFTCDRVALMDIIKKNLSECVSKLPSILGGTGGIVPCIA